MEFAPILYLNGLHASRKTTRNLLVGPAFGEEL
jgi:hypothetical protein